VRKLVASAISILLAVVSGSAGADPADTIGIGHHARAGAGAVTASASGMAAAYYNPGALADTSSSASFGLSAVQVLSELSPGAADAGGGSFLEVGGALPLLNREGVPPIWLGVAALMPSSGFYEMRLQDDTARIFPLYSSRERRLSLSAAVGARVFDALSLGVGIQMLPTVRADVALDLSDSTGNHALDVDVGYTLSPTAGILVHPISDLSVGLAWHGENHTWLDLPVDVSAGGVALDALVTTQTYYVPHRLSLGIEWRLHPKLAVEADAAWQHFSGFSAGAPEVSLYAAGGKDILGVRNTDPGFSDTVTPSLAVTLRGPVELSAGYRYSPSPIPEQSGDTNLLGGDAHTVAAGTRVVLSESEAAPRRLLLDAACFLTWLPEQRDYKDRPLVGNPGYPNVAYGGTRIGLGVGLEVEY